MKKIVFLHPAHWEQTLGGAEIQISYLVKYLNSLDYTIHYIYEEREEIILNTENINLHPLKRINLWGPLGKKWFLYSKRIDKILCDIQPDIIYTRLYSSWSYIAAKHTKNHQIKHIWAIASDNDVKKKSILNLLIQPLNLLEYILVNRAYKNATYILVQNSFQQTEVKTRFRRSGIKILQMSPLVNEKLLKKSDKKTRLVWIANFKTIKRPEYFIKLDKDSFSFHIIQQFL